MIAFRCIVPAALLFCSGCLSLSKSEPIIIERMDPLPLLLEGMDGSEPDDADARPLRILPTLTAPQIGEMLRVRVRPGLVDSSDTVRWAVLPSSLVDQALANGVHSRSGWRHGGDFAATTLEVHLQRFGVDLTGGSAVFVLDARWVLEGPGGGEAGRQVHSDRVTTRLPLADRSAATISATAAEAVQRLLAAIPSAWPNA